MTRDQITSSALSVVALLATGVWHISERALETGDAAQSLMTTDAVARVASDRQHSVVLLH